MLIVSYDISDNKVRSRFSKFLSKFGYRLQYSVFRIKNSERMLSNIVCEIEGNFAQYFTQTDSVIIFVLSRNCKKLSFGYTKNDEEELIFVE